MVKSIKNRINNLFDNKLCLIWISIFLAVLSGVAVNVFVTYKFGAESYYLSPYYGWFINIDIIIQIVALLILSLSSSIVLKLINFEKLKGFWSRFICCIISAFIAVLFVSFILEFITGNTIHSPNIIKALIYSLTMIIAIISGLIFINPWIRLLNFAIGTIYVALLFTALVYFPLLLAGYFYNDWL